MTNPPIKVFPSEPQKPNQRLFFIRNDYSFKTLDNLYVCVMVCVGNVLQIHTISTAHKKKKNKSRAGFLPFSFSFFRLPEENAKINK